MTHIVQKHYWCRGADWVFLLDADEFLPFMSKHQFLEAMSSHVNHAIIRMPWKNVIPESYEDDRISSKRFYIPNCFAKHSKVAFQPRLLPVKEYVVAQGNHDLLIGKEQAPLLATNSFFLYHAPVRSFDQLRKKLESGIASYRAMEHKHGSELGLHWKKIDELIKVHGLDDTIANYLAYTYGVFDFSDGFRMTRQDLINSGAILKPLDVALDNVVSVSGDVEVDFENTINITVERNGEVRIVGMTMKELFCTEPAPKIDKNKDVANALGAPNIVAIRKSNVLPNFLESSYAPVRHLTPTAWAGHIPFMFAAMHLLRPRRFVELGSYWGCSFFAACQAVSTYGGDCDCVAIDLWQGDHQTGFYDEEVFINFKWILQKNYADIGRYIRDDFTVASNRFEDGSIDLLHIDGLHTYEAVKNDFDTWRPKLSPNGTILFHDTSVRRADFGVFRLWSEIKDDVHSFEFKHAHGLGIYAIGGIERNPMAFLIDYIKRHELEDFVQLHFSRLGKLIECEAIAKLRDGGSQSQVRAAPNSSTPAASGC